MGQATSERRWDDEYDLVILGSGAAGMATALVGANEGLKVLILEKSDHFGGSTCYSAGTTWIPDSKYVREAGIKDDKKNAEIYLENLVGDRGPREMWQAYLDNGPAMIDYMERHGITFIPFPGFVDYYPELPGAGHGYRALEPKPFDGKKLGRRDFPHLRGPVPEFALFGGQLMVRRTEVNDLLAILDHASPKGIFTALKLGVAWVWDLVRLWPRGTRMVMGNALIANLFYNVKKVGGKLWLNANTLELITDGDRVAGAVVEYKGKQLRVRARKGVVMAAGGFPGSAEKRNEFLRQPAAQYTRAVETSTGDTFDLVQQVGGVLGQAKDDVNGALWFPSSVGYRGNGSEAVFPHIWDRAKPGMIAVNAAGKRFTDEARSYNHFVRGMYESNEAGVPTIPCWLIADHAHMMKYGLGMIYPKGVGLKMWLDRGYVLRARTPRELAAKIGVDPTGLEQTLRKYNADCATGIDSEFHKGESDYSPQYGDPEHLPNVNLGPLEKAPFYAMAVYPTPLSTGKGIKINPTGQVLNASDQPIEGLYACGSDAEQVFGVQYPGGGCQVGAGMTFGYVIGRHAAQQG